MGRPWDSAAAGGTSDGATREASGCPARVSGRALRTVGAKALRRVLAARGAARGSAAVRPFVRQRQRKQVYNFVGDGRTDSGWSAAVVSSCVTNFAVGAAVNAELRPRVSLWGRRCGSQRQQGWAGTSWKREDVQLRKSFEVSTIPLSLRVVLCSR